ncbi:hypothetical protein [Paenibacillus peoriae]|uniref:hypothetical protein n=1 Tax=Paenibacillus peoriae TaxID=59893 RepID=UPI0035C6DB8E
MILGTEDPIIPYEHGKSLANEITDALLLSSIKQRQSRTLFFRRWLPLFLLLGSV